jgi:S-methylmethionine-dependent homocysteine/selenocysteine methylase
VVLAPRLGGEFRLEEVVRQVAVPEGAVVAIMHTQVEETLPALKILRSHWAGRIGVYPHSGEFRMPHWQFDTVMAPDDFLAHARTWVDLGARMIGGCCGIGPEHIRVLAENLD